MRNGTAPAVLTRTGRAPGGLPGAVARRAAAALLLACVIQVAARSSVAQPYARFAVPDSALAGAIRASGAQFETAWNALLIAELRASLAGADSAARLLTLARRVAELEPSALGTRNAAAALRLRAAWTPARRRLRVAAAVDESLAASAQGLRDYPRADSLFGAALHAYQRLGESRRIAWVWGSRGAVAFVRGDMAAADTLYRHALAARRSIGDQPMTGNALNTLGSVAFRLGRLDDAWRFYGEARSVRERTSERAALGTTLNNLGNVAARMGRRDSAEVFFRAALDLTVAEGDSGRAHEVLNNYGELLRSGDDPASALPYFERALAIRRQRGDLGGQAQVLSNIGGVLGQTGHFGEAFERLAEARGLALAAPNVPILREILINRGRVAIGLGDPAAAREPLERAVALAESLGNRGGEADALTNLSIAARLDGDLDGADRLAARAFAAATAAGDSSHVHHAATTLGELAFDREDLATAERWFRRAAQAGGTEASARAGDILNLGAVAARRGRLAEADTHFVRALALAGGGKAPDQAWPALLGRGDVAERRGDHAGALAFDRQAATMIDSLRSRQGSERPSVRLLARRMFAFEALIHLLTRLSPQYPDSGFAAEAFHWSERARARAFLDLVAASGSSGRQARPLTLPEAQRLLESDREALLAYSVGDSSTSLWVLRRRAWTHVALPSRGALKTRIEILRRGLGDPATADAPATRRAARALYRALIEPARPMLDGAQHLIVAPDGILAFVPFEALLAADAEGEGPPPRGAYLVERHAISYAPSASALATRLEARGAARAGGIVAIGNPDFGPGRVDGAPAGARAARLPALPHTAAEIEVLSALAGRLALASFTGREATRDRFVVMAGLPQAALIHVATHGVANEVEPERSGLWLAAAGPDSTPGFVSMSDILGLELDAGLVTLSACETGLGRIERGEGVIGLTRAFLAAGARSVLVSLWNVNDRSTALLMQGFYRGLLRDDATAAIALARAKRALLRREETRSPFHWAPFVLVGSAGRLGG